MIGLGHICVIHFVNGTVLQNRAFIEAYGLDDVPEVSLEISLLSAMTMNAVVSVHTCQNSFLYQLNKNMNVSFMMSSNLCCQKSIQFLVVFYLIHIS